MKYSSIEDIKELTDVSEVLKCIESGWEVINIYNAPVEIEGIISNSQKQVFTLAWSKENPLRSDLTSRYDGDYSDWSL